MAAQGRGRRLRRQVVVDRALGPIEYSAQYLGLDGAVAFAIFFAVKWRAKKSKLAELMNDEFRTIVGLMSLFDGETKLSLCIGMEMNKVLMNISFFFFCIEKSFQ
jgi:hypothetical protein